MRLTKAQLKARIQAIVVGLSTAEGEELLKKLHLNPANIVEGKKLFDEWSQADLICGQEGSSSQEHTQLIRKRFRQLKLEMTLLDVDLKACSSSIRTSFRVNPRFRRFEGADGQVTRKAVRSKQGMSERIEAYQQKILQLMRLVNDGQLELIDWGPGRIAEVNALILDVLDLIAKKGNRKADLVSAREDSKIKQQAARFWLGHMSRKLRQSVLLRLKPNEAEEWLYRLGLKTKK